MPAVSPTASSGQLISSTENPATSTRISDQGTHSSSLTPAARSSGTPGCGTGFKWLVNQLVSCFVDREEWGQFFTRHFTSPSFNRPDEGGTINAAQFNKQKSNYVSQLRNKVKGSQHIRVLLDALPECRAESFSRSLMIKDPVLPKHVSLLLLQLTFRELNKVLEEDAGTERVLHIDLGRRQVAEESASHPEGSTQQKGFFLWSFKDVANAMAHIGALSKDPENKNIPGLTVTADLSGLKIKALEELDHLHNLILRSTISDAHIDLSLIGSSLQVKAWEDLAKMVVAKKTENLQNLTVNVPTQIAIVSISNAEVLDVALCAPTCPLQSLNLIGGDWTDEAKAVLSNIVKKRQDMEQPITITIDGQKLEPPMERESTNASEVDDGGDVRQPD